MVSSAEVLRVLSEIKAVFSGLNKDVSLLDESWEGVSKNSIISQIKFFSSDVSEILSSQLNDLASAVDKAKRYNELDEKCETLRKQYDTAVALDENPNSYLSELLRCQDEMNELKKEILGLLSLITDKTILKANDSSFENDTNVTPSSNVSYTDYPVDEYGIVIKNDGVPRSGTAAEKQAFLYPEGRPTSSAEASKHIIETTVEYLDTNGNRQKAKIRVHKALEEDIQEIFSKIADTGFKMKPSDYGSGAYIESFYYKDGGTSEHCLGAAVDINVADNPYTSVSRDSSSGQNYNPSNNEYAITEEVANIFRSYGWSWGGADWNSNKTGRIYDYMHFDFTELGPQTQK